MKRPITGDALITELARQGHLPDATPQPACASHRPWYLAVVLGVSGWMAGAFVLAFAAMLFDPDSAAGAGLLGAVLLAAAFGLYAADRDNAFFDQLALALSIAGQFAMAWSATEATDSAAGVAALVCVLQLAILAVMPNALAKTLAAFFASCAWALAVRFAWWGDPEFRLEREAVDLAPALLGWLVVWAPIVALVHMLIASEHVWMTRAWRSIARPALGGLLVGLSLATWASQPFAALQFWNQESGAPTNWLALWPLLGALAGLTAAYYAFRLRSRPMLGIALAGALLHVGQFYFLLGATLLAKSGLMLALGAAALIGAAWLQRTRPGAHQEDAA